MWTTLLSFGKSYYLYIIGAVLIASGIGYVSYIRHDNAKTHAALDGALQVNAQQHATIDTQSLQITQNLSTCEKRLSAKDSECDNLLSVENLTTQEVSTHETTSLSGSPLLNALNAQWVP